MLSQIKRSGKYAIFAQSQGGTVLSYEVITVQTLPASTIMGRSYPVREGYPHAEQWGEQAWTCVTLERANERYRNLLPS